MRKRSNITFLLLALMLAIPAVLGLLHSGFFVSDDGNWMVIRFSAFFEALRNGEFPVRFLPHLNSGYGYPVADFLYPLFMYIGAPIHIFKVSFVDTVKIILGLSMILSSVFSFLWLRKQFDNISSLLGSAIYTFFPYHLWDIYKRGSVGEVLALGIVPFILWAIELESLPLAGLGYGLLIIAHNSLSLLFLPVLFGYQLLRSSKRRVMKSLKVIELGLMLSAFFWLPALYDKQFTVFDKTSVADFTKYFVSDFSLLGLVTLVSLTGSLFFLVKKDKKFIYFFAVTLFSLFLSTEPSKMVWQNLPIVGFIQFPFRVLSIAVLGVSFLVAYQLDSLKKRAKIGVAVIYLALIFVSAWPFLFPKNYQYYPDTFYSTNQDSTTVKNEYMPKWVPKASINRYSNKAEVVTGKATITNVINKGNKTSFNISSSEKSTVQVNTVYFPGWKVYIDGEDTPIDYNGNGLIRFNVPSGSHVVVAKFGETQIRMIADFLSLLGLLLVIILLVRKFRKS